MIFTLDNNHKAELEKLASSGMTPIVIAQRAKILLLKYAGKSATAIADEVRVKSKEELVQRIYLYFDEINAEPVVFHWTWHLDDIDPSESVYTDSLLEICTDLCRPWGR